jgi:hypothetical protein
MVAANFITDGTPFNWYLCAAFFPDLGILEL